MSGDLLLFLLLHILCMVICSAFAFSGITTVCQVILSEFSFSDLFIIKKDNVFSSLLITAEASMKSTSSALSLEYLGESILSFKDSPLPYNDAK